MCPSQWTNTSWKDTHSTYAIHIAEVLSLGRQSGVRSRDGGIAMRRTSKLILLLQLAMAATLIALVAIRVSSPSSTIDTGSYLGAAVGLAITVVVLAAVRLLIGSHSHHLS
jgi:hypothetical protein